MQKDFHYYVVKLLAIKAGIAEEEAQIIAYSSQYVDDAVEHKPIRLSHQLPAEITDSFTPGFDRYKDDRFDPVCTAHRGTQHIGEISRNVQRLIYMPFHFLPPGPVCKQKRSASYITRAGSPFALELVEAALETLEQNSGSGRVHSLIKLGIALHTYSDTWSHNGFSGRHSPAENDISELSVFENGRWKMLPAAKRALLNFSPDIGHAEAGILPDMSHVIIRYRHCRSGNETVCNNPEIFMAAAKAVYAVLCKIERNYESWKSFEGDLRYCIAASVEDNEEKARLYEKTFPQISFYYDEEEWRKEALSGSSYDREKFRSNDFRSEAYSVRGDMKWFWFHVGAWEQRQHLP
ncbi:MAG: hypothetical protein KJ607_06015 [Bacteroidetes bacterium]|nr:hypothetical protein [Bacteroidota bacterium]